MSRERKGMKKSLVLGLVLVCSLVLGSGIALAGWGEAEIIDNGAYHAEQAKLALDSSNNAIVTFRQYDEHTIFGTYAAHYNKEDSFWSGLQRINPDSNYTTGGAQIAFDSRDRAIAVYEQFGAGSPLRIYANRWDGRKWQIWDESGWTSIITDGDPIDLDLGVGCGSLYPRIAFDSQDNAICTYEQYDSTRRRIYAVRYDAEHETWGLPVTIDRGLHDACAPQIAIDGNGNAICTFNQLDDSSIYRTYANRYLYLSDTWETPEIIDDGSDLDAAIGGNPHYIRKIVFDEHNNALTVFLQRKDGIWRIYANKFDAFSSSWIGAEIISNPVDYGCAENQIALNPSNNHAIAVFAQDDGSARRIYATEYNGSSWSTPEAIDFGPYYGAAGPQITFGDNNTAICVFECGDGTYTRIAANRYVNGRWSTPEIIDIGGYTTFHSVAPQICYEHGTGNAMAVFHALVPSSPDIMGRIFANRYTAVGEDGVGGDGHSHGHTCFIATAAYIPVEPVYQSNPSNLLTGRQADRQTGVQVVETLCSFRDQHLLTNPLGKTLVRFYYSHSPWIADFIRDKEILRAVVRAELRPLVKVLKRFNTFL